MIQYIYNLDKISEIVLEILSKTSKKIFVLNGNVGVGKTTLVKEFIKQLGFNRNVTSPTYSIVNEYKIEKKTIFHIDLYRLQSLNAILDCGIEEYLYSGYYCFIEWGKLLEHWDTDLQVIIKIKYKKKNRKIFISL